MLNFIYYRVFCLRHYVIWFVVIFQLKNNDSVCGKKKEVVYSEIYNRLPLSITKEAAAQLSYPIAFMAILHMANEKNLRLIGDGHQSDFTVSLDTPP